MNQEEALKTLENIPADVSPVELFEKYKPEEIAQSEHAIRILISKLREERELYLKSQEEGTKAPRSRKPKVKQPEVEGDPLDTPVKDLS